MRILLLSQYYLPQPLANAEVIGALTRDLAALGHDVVVVSPVRNATPPKGVSHRRALGWFSKDRASIPRRIVEYTSFSAGALLALARVPRPDVVIVPSPPPTLGLVGLAGARVRRRPFVYNVQDLYPEVATAVASAPSTFVAILRRIVRRVYAGAAAVVVIDPVFVNAIVDAEPRASVTAIRNGIDLEPFENAHRDAAYLEAVGVPADSRVVMYAGNVGRSQDLDAVIGATHAADAHLVIHGGGAQLDALRLRSDARAHVHFSDYRPRSELGIVFGSADLHVVPLRPGVAWASVPSKLLSIFAAGRPVVLAAERGSPAAELVAEARAGWVVEPGDPGALRDATLEALAVPAELVDRGRAARQWAVENAGTERAASEWDQLLKSIVR